MRLLRFWLPALAGVGAITFAFIVGPSGPPRPLLSSPSESSAGSGRALARSTPVSVRIPAIGVSASVVSTGLAADNSIDVPRPEVAGWYRYGPSPGEAGSAVIVGHVDSRAWGPAVFYSLGLLHKGDHIMVVRDDGTTVAFQVTGVQFVAKDAFPAAEVHKISPHPLLRLITCGGPFDRAQRSYMDNVIVYASAL